MPGVSPPSSATLQGFVGKIQALALRITNLETWQRQTTHLQSGAITQWGGATLPAGALACNGATFTAAEYPGLYAALGTTSLPNIPGTPTYIIWT